MLWCKSFSTKCNKTNTPITMRYTLFLLLSALCLFQVKAQRLTSVILQGSAAENGQSLTLSPLHDGVFEGYMKARPGHFVLMGKDAEGRECCLGQDAQGKLRRGADSLYINKEEVVQLRVDSEQSSISITPVQLFLRGNIVTPGTTLPYLGEGVWGGEVAMMHGDIFLFSDKHFYFAFNNQDSLAVRRLRSNRNKVGIEGEGFHLDNIRINRGTYTVRLDMNHHTWDISAPVDPLRISAFGSSVCNGQGARGNRGYAYMYGQQLEQRFNDRLSATPFHVSGVSIGGNTTINLLDRYDELIHDFGHYVIIGLSLGNEGIHGAKDQEAVFRQFSTNMQRLIQQMRADGKEPVVMNNYTRADYTPEDYHYVKLTNLAIHQWDVPSVNVLGAIDKGNGQWADGYVDDPWHQNTEGHREFMLAMTPSLFDALLAGKPQPVRDTTECLTLDKGQVLTFQGEGIVHPFTLCTRLTGADAGRLFTVQTEDKALTLDVTADGHLLYTAPDGTAHRSEMACLTKGKTTHTISLTHYYAQRRTIVYVDDTIALEMNDGLHFAPLSFAVGDATKRLKRAYSELFFWRSAMTLDEMQALHHGALLKSSLEIYAPLSKGKLENRAQSMNNSLR